MATEDFLNITIKDVTFQWPRVDQPYRFNKMESRSEPCAAAVSGAAYSIQWDMPNNEAKELFDTLKDHYNKTRARNPKLPPFSAVFGMKKNEAEGKTRFTAKTNAVKADGSLRKPPQVVEVGSLAPLEDKAIWGGSVGALKVSAFATVDPENRGGISLGLSAVVVKKAVYGGSLQSEFGDYGAEEGFEIADAAPRAAAPVTPPPVAQPAAQAASTVPEDVAF